MVTSRFGSRPLLRDNSGERLAIALFADSRYNAIELHFDKGLAVAPLGVIDSSCDEGARVLAPNNGSYVSESNFFENDWKHSYWGDNYSRLASVKKKYDPSGLFFVHNGVGSEEWSADGFTKL